MLQLDAGFSVPQLEAGLVDSHVESGVTFGFSDSQLVLLAFSPQQPDLSPMIFSCN